MTVPVAATQVIPLRLAVRRDAARETLRRAEPVRLGIPIPRGLARDGRDLALVRDGSRVPVQARVLDRWVDGSARWVLLDFQFDGAGGSGDYEIHIVADAAASDAPSLPAAVRVSEGHQSVTVETGQATFTFRKGGHFPFETASRGGSTLIDVGRTMLSAADGSGAPCTVTVDEVSTEERGPLHAVIYTRSSIRRGEAAWLDLVTRVHFYAGSATVRFDLTVRNSRRARHPGGLWDLGDPASALLKDLALTFALPSVAGPVDVSWTADGGSPVERCASDLELYQDSSGGENWRSSNHLNRNHQVPNAFRGYRVRAAGSERFGLRAAPTVTIARGERELTVAVPYFWQNFPKAIEVSGDAVTLRLFPRQYGDLHEIQGGEQKTHTFFVAFAPDRVTEQLLVWCHSPAVVHADPAWHSSSGALPYLVPAASNPDREYLELGNAAMDGGDTFDRKREVIDEYGWRHFGDIYGDHEQVYAGERSTPLASHYNNQYDAVGGFAYRFLATGDARWFDAMNELAAHVIDIDIYHTTEDKAAYNHGLFWHTYHYVDADIATHRSYPSASKAIVKGGGPSAEQNYATGLMLHYFLTGNAESRQTAIDLAQFVVDLDDGRKTVFRWLDRGATGLASASGSPTYHGPGRGSGNSLSVLLDGHRLSGNALFLDKAEALIRRCIHPADDIAARNLLDVERKWFYTMFLQSLAKYLDYKVERGELDHMYAYGRASLLHYARWMAANERPYLDRPQVLQYPTETWAAQDIRKSDVFSFAAMHADAPEREPFLERATFFFTYSVTTLRSLPTRTFARPVVVLLSNGLMHAYLQRHPVVHPPTMIETNATFDKPGPFVPQRIRAVRRFRVIVAAAIVALATAAIWLGARWL